MMVVKPPAAPLMVPTVGASLVAEAVDEIREAFHVPRNTLFLHPKQMEVYASAGRFKVVVAGRRWGKALALDTPIPTPHGWTTMGELRDGDEVFDESGKPCRVTHAHAVMHGRPCYEIEFSDGTKVVADEEHLWSTWDKAARKNVRRNPSDAHGAKVRTTRQIIDTLTAGTKDENNHSIPCAGAVQYPEARLQLDPYILGAWLGDGDSRCAALTCGDEELPHFSAAVEKLIGAKPHMTQDPRTGVWRVAITGGRGCEHGFQKGLRELNLLANKHIPRAYLQGSVAQRLALMQGLMDTDGSIFEHAGNCEFTSVNKRLADDVLELALSLGIKATLITGTAKLNGRDCGAKYRVRFTTAVQVFRLPRKAEKNLRARKFRVDHRFIVAVRPVESVPVRCITVDSPNALYLCSRAFIATHNTQLAKVSLIKFARKKKRLVWYVAPSYRMAKQIMWPELVESIPRAWVKKYNETILTITLVNGTKIELKGADNPDCFDEQTEILTPDGWVFLKNLPEDLAVMTLNRETNSAEWQVPTRHIHQQYDGPMFKLESGKLDMLVTPGHRFLVDTRKGARKFKTLDDIAHQDRIPASVEWAGEDDDFWTHDMVAFMGFYIAEGCARKDPGPKKSYEVTFAQTRGIKGGSKGDVRANFIEVLKRLGASFGEGEDSIRVYGKKWWELTHRLGLAWEKRIPQEILDLPPEKLRTLLHWMIAGDGTDRNGERVYYTTSYGLAGDVQEVCMKIGQSAAVSLKHETGNEACLKDGRTITARRDLYQVAIYRNKFIHFRDSKESYIKTVEDFSGIVHCVEVPNQTIYVRRNGKATWSGNSLRGVGIHYLVMDEVQDIDPEAWTKVLRPTLASTGGHALFIGCVRGDTKVLTRSGPIEIASLSKGERDKSILPIDLEVYGINREYHRADGFWNNGMVKTRVIDTRKGFQIEASEPHPVMVMKEHGTPVWKRTDQLEVGDRVAIGSGMEQWGGQDPLAGFDRHIDKWRESFRDKRGPKPTALVNNDEND